FYAARRQTDAGCHALEEIMQRTVFVTILAAACAQARAGEPAKPGAKDVETDVTKEVLDMNSGKYAAPPTTFRVGNVTPHPLDKKIVAQGQSGWSVRLPSGAPIRSPAVYDGMVFASGGFHSREFYAFDARTGKPVGGPNLDDDGPPSTACEDGPCGFTTRACTLFSVDAKTGKLLWSWWLGDPLMSAPTIAHGRVFTAYPAAGRGQQPSGTRTALATPPGQSHALAAFDLKTGKI